MNPLKTVMNTDEGLMEWQIDDIFGNIEEIKEASDKMSRALQLCQLADPQYFGQVFLNRVRPPYTCDNTAPHPLLIDDRTPTQMEDLQKYEEVCVHQQIATDALQEALHSHKAFRSFCEVRPKLSPERMCEFELNRTPLHLVQAAQKHKDCKKLSIDALLIKPFQRITKYPLLLRVRVPGRCTHSGA